MTLRRAVVASGTALLLAVVALEFVGRHGFSARERPSAVEEYVARHLRRMATPAAVRERGNPVEPTALHIAEGRDHFADHCATCHANDGSGHTMINAGLYPPAPDLRTAASRELSDGELFAIIENGIRFTGMPGWGGEAEGNWRLVLFIRHLPELSQTERGLMTEVNGLE